MSSGISISQRIIERIAHAIQVLRIGIARHDGIRTQEPPQLGRIKSCIEMIDAQACHFSLSREQPIRVDRPRGETRLAEGIIALFAENGSAGIGHDAG